MADGRYLPIYLNDHLAGATAAGQLVQRAASSNRDNEFGPALDRLAGELEEDRRTLRDVMARLDVGVDRVKLLIVGTAERAGRLKLNGELLRYSPLSRLEELEMLSLGIEGKAALWIALRDQLGADARLAGVDLEDLIKRARAQRRRVERLRRQAAEIALSAE